MGNKVLVTIVVLDKYSTTPYKGSYEIMEVNDNVMVRIQMGAVLVTVTIPCVCLYNM